MIPFFTCRYPLPEAVRTLLQTLEQAGFEAYAVGGCVRDTLLGRTPHDWDITTAATPDEVERVFAASPFKVVGTVGRAFGVSLVEWAGATYEVATFRGEEYGADSHRPEKVYYAKHLADDLARRDFTVNAMAFRSDGILIDPYDGRKDLRKKRLQTVGAPDERFREDALRLFRACRFIAQLGFRPTRELCAAMPPAFARVEGLSLERVRAELDRRPRFGSFRSFGIGGANVPGTRTGNRSNGCDFTGIEPFTRNAARTLPRLRRVVAYVGRCGTQSGYIGGALCGAFP